MNNQEEKLLKVDTDTLLKAMDNQFAKGFQAGKSQQIEDEIRFLKEWESLFWEITNCECCKYHKSKLQDRIKKLQENLK